MLIGLQWLETNILASKVRFPGDDASGVNFLNLVQGFDKIPLWMKPQISGSYPPAEALKFGKPTARMTKTNQKEVIKGSHLYLNTKIDWANTVAEAYDGKKLFRYIMDECFAKGTKILCENLEFRNIEDIKIGDKVIVEGNKIMEVGATCHGEDEMFLVKQPYSKDYVVNSKHRLYLEQRNRRGGNRKKDYIRIITPKQYLELNKYDKRTIYRVKSKGIEFEYQETFIDPYLFGAWLGDGRKESMCWIVNREKDLELYQFILDYCNRKNYEFSETKSTSDKCCYITVKDMDKSNKKHNTHIQSLKELGVFSNKRIPKEYLHNSREVRLNVLAGLIDTDGCVHRNCYVFGLAKKDLIEDIKLLADSLGFDTSHIAERMSNFNSVYYFYLQISGNLSTIPCKIKRKQLTEYRSRLITKQKM